MGWTMDDFWLTPPSFFYAALRGHLEQERERANNGLRQARIVAYYTYLPHISRGSNFSMSDIVWLPEDGERLDAMVASVNIEPENRKRFDDDADEFFKQWQAQQAAKSQNVNG